MPRHQTETEKVNAGPDKKGLEKFVQAGDRAAPLHFAGRKAELREMEALLDSVKEGTPGLTRVITAAPGAGKTALLRKLEARWRDKEIARPVYMRADSFSNPAEVIESMFDAIDTEAAKRFGVVETKTEAQHAEGGVKLAGLGGKAGVRSSHSMQRTNLPVTFFAAFLELKGGRELKGGETPVVLLVDEAQMWGTDKDEERNRRISSLLAEAHVNEKRLPLLIVAAGLGDAPEVIAKRGASKLATGTRLVLGPLADDEMREVCGKFFDRYRIAGSEEQRAEWIETIIAGTDGWPRHLTNALRGASESLIAGQGDLAQSSLEAARTSGQNFRRQFYEDQLAPFQRMPALLSAVFAAMPQGAGTRGVFLSGAISQAYEETPALAKQMRESEVFTELLHKGLIQDFGDNRYDCPIPSMRRYVEEFCAESGCPIVPAVAEAAPPAAPVLEPSGGMD